MAASMRATTRSCSSEASSTTNRGPGALAGFRFNEAGIETGCIDALISEPAGGRWRPSIRLPRNHSIRSIDLGCGLFFGRSHGVGIDVGLIDRLFLGLTLVLDRVGLSLQAV